MLADKAATMPAVPFNLRLLARQIAASVFPRGNTTLRLGSRRIRFLAVFVVAFPAIWLFGVVGMFLDNIVYPRCRRVAARFPVFIVGNFRSGSSFLLRLLAADRRNFTCMKTWELYFAPSVVQRRFWKGLWTVDGFFGSPVKRRVLAIQERLLSEVRLHRVRLQEPEEDEALFYLTWHTLFTCFFFPVVYPRFPYHRFDTALPRRLRRRLLAFYKGCVDRHLYAHRSTAHYLAKNPSATSRIASLLETYPEARFVYLYRDPLETVPSTMRWFSFAWHYFSSARERYPLRQFVLDLTMEWYRYPLDLLRTEAARHLLFVSYEELVTDPVGAVRRIYGWLGTDIDEAFTESLRRDAAEAKLHRPDGVGDLQDTGLTHAAVLDRFGEVAEACRRAVAADRSRSPLPG